MFITPWNEKSTQILRQLSLNGRAYSKDTFFIKKFATQKSVRTLIKMNFLDIARNHRKGKSIFVTPPDVMVIPKPGDFGINFHFKRFKTF